MQISHETSHLEGSAMEVCGDSVCKWFNQCSWQCAGFPTRGLGGRELCFSLGTIKVSFLHSFLLNMLPSCFD